MNSADVITFGCPSCNTRLTVPTQMAGVTGPCPYCQVTIQAPYPVPPARSAPVYTHPAPPSQESVQATTAYYAPPPLQQYYSPPPQQYQPQPRTPEQTTILRPEPRQLPNRSEPVEAPTRIRRDPSGDIRARAEAAGPPPQRHHRSRFLRFIVPVIFLCIAGGVVYGVKTFLQVDRTGKTSLKSESSDNESAQKVKSILHENSFEALTGGDAETLPVGEPNMPTIGDDAPGEAPAPSLDSGIEALKLLEEFLAMNSLQERMPHLESKRTDAELASSPLAGPLPEVMKITVDVRETNSLEQLVDHYYYIDFADDDGGVNRQTMLVRLRGTADPKVVVDPFLDLFGGRFERYAAKPVKEAGTFQVVISAGARCYDDIPGAEKKRTLKILAREDTKEIAKAYFGIQSKIGMMLEDETSGLAFGQAKACTVFMRWNMDEDPERPFLEALDITSLNWNP